MAEPTPSMCLLQCRAIARGDEAAFAAFYRQWFAPVLSLARGASRRDEDYCLDLVQDVMTAVVHKLPPLADERAVRGWLTTTLLHRLADRRREELRRQRRDAEVVAMQPVVDPVEPWSELAADERSQWLQACLAELPDCERALLVARFGDGESVAAAGAGFGIGADAAHGRLRRVLQRLRQRAAEWWHGD